MPKLSDLLREQPATGGKLKLSQLVGQQNDFSSSDYPPIAGPTGFSPQFTEATGMSGAEAIPGALADMFGTYEDVKNAVAPGAKVIKDRDGVEVLELPDGRRFKMNDKGLDLREVLSGAARTGLAISAGRFMGAGAGGLGRMIGLNPANAGTLTRAAVAGAGAAAGDAGAQKIAGRDSIDPLQSAVAGAFGAGGEIASPYIGAGVSKVASWLRGDKGALEAGKSMAQQIGANVSDDVALQLGKRADEIKAGASPQAILAEIELGVPLTQGQRMSPDAAKAFQQISREEALANNPNSMGGGVVRDMRQQQNQALSQALGRVEEAIGGANRPMSPAAAAEVIQPAVRGARNAAKAETDALYTALRGSNATFSDAGVRQVPGLARQAVADFDVEVLPATSRALKMLDEAMAGDQPIQRVSQIMTRLTNSVGAAANQADRAAMLKIKGAMQAWMDSAAESAVVSGDEAAIKLLKNARESRAALARLFENKETAGNVVPQLVKGAKSPEELAQLMFGASNVSPAATTSVARQVKAAIGDNAEAWNAFRTATLLQATRNRAGEALGPKELATNLTRLLNTRPELMKTLFTQQEQSMLGSVANAARQLSPRDLREYGAGNMAGITSGTAERILRFISETATRSPIIGSLLRGVNDAGVAISARAPVTGIGPRIGAGFGAAAQPANDRMQQNGRR